jgi:hypothetical protein
MTASKTCGETTTTTLEGVQRTWRRGHNRRVVGSKGWLEGGYRFIRVNGRKIADHRHVVEQREGRMLARNEIVHHIDGDPLNNDSNNLLVLTRSEHQRFHAGRPRSRWTADEKRRARQLHHAGMTIIEVSKALGRPFSSTARHVVTSSV